MNEIAHEVSGNPTAISTDSGGGAMACPAGTLLFLAGSFLNLLAYASFEPLIIAGLFGLVGLFIVRTTRMGGVYEDKMYRIVFSIGWLMAGVAAVYANYWNDALQNGSDAASFYALASGSSRDLSLEDLKVLSEGAGAVVVWRWFYDALAGAGFHKGRYVGVLINVFSIALTGVIAIKMAKRVFGEDTQRLNRLILLFSLCGLFWLFAAIHLRDAVVLLTVTTLAYYWVRYLTGPQAFNFGLLVSATVVCIGVFGFLRTEFVLVPLAMLMAGSCASLLFTSSTGVGRFVVYATAVVGLITIGSIYILLRDDLSGALQGGQESYVELAVQNSADDSLGKRYIVNAPLPLRVIVGSVYLFIFPIPAWSGFQLESAYHLFKAFNVLFFYAVTPLFALAVIRLYKTRTLPAMFLLFLVVGFTVGVAGTSLETRHLGAFLVPVLVLATIPDVSARHDRVTYKRLLFVFLAMIVGIHVMWAAVKFIR